MSDEAPYPPLNPPKEGWARIEFIEVVDATGEIFRHGRWAEPDIVGIVPTRDGTTLYFSEPNEEIQAQPRQHFHVPTHTAYDPATHYAAGQSIAERPVFTNRAINKSSVQADGEDTATVPNMPAGTKVTARRLYHIEAIVDRELDASGPVSLAFDEPGTYEVILEAFPYQAIRFIVEAT